MEIKGEVSGVLRGKEGQGSTRIFAAFAISPPPFTRRCFSVPSSVL